MGKQDYAIQLKGLTKAFKDKEVLKGVSFDVEKGSIFCLLGSNGSGKTTTVKILSTLQQMDHGSAYVNGFDINTEGAKVRKSISLTGQFVAVDDILSGRENMEMVARLCHVKNYKEEADKLLHDFNLEDAANRHVSTYSGGMRRRLDIAMSLLGSPEVIFLDEPTTGLDPQSRNAMWKLIQELKNKGVTIFLTTQYLEEAEELADQVAILHNGVIIANGSVNDIKKISSNEYVTFTFTQRDSMDKMSEVFKDKIILDTQNQSATFEIGEGMEQLTTIFMTMQAHNIQSSSFTQKKATLEDVFLHLVDGEKEQPHE